MTVPARLPVIMIVMAAAAIGGAHASERIEWALIDFPPFQILDGSAKETGSFDGLLQLLIRRMPQYGHDIVPMTFARREAESREGQAMCTPGMFRTPAREAYWEFSRPALLHLDNRIVFLADSAGKFPGEGPVDLEALFLRDDVVGGIAAGRSYAPNIDALVQRYGTTRRNLVVRPVRADQFFQMLLGGEIDYVILFPHEANFMAERYGAGGRIAVRPIAGTPATITTSVACTRTPLGHEVIAAVDATVAAQLDDPDYRMLSERWYGEADKTLIRRHYGRQLEGR